MVKRINGKIKEGNDIAIENDYTIYNCKTNTTPEYVHYVIYD